ncbi:hypothetical protein GCM10010330_63240 [Streptomyces tendae]|nr:hypothetical protein GCM10010330_63240 [Streptomyces tendae]
MGRDAGHLTVRPSAYRPRMDMNNPQDVGAAFGALILGGTLSEEPPPPDSPLGRVRAFTARYGEDALKPEHIRDAQEGRPLLP